MSRHVAYLDGVRVVNETDKGNTMADEAVNRKDEVMAIDAARDVLGDLVARADYAGTRTIITRYGKEAAAIIGIRDLQRLEALDDAA